MACAGCAEKAGGQAGPCYVVTVPLGKGQLDLVLRGAVTAADISSGAFEEYCNFAMHVFRRALKAPAAPEGGQHGNG